MFILNSEDNLHVLLFFGNYNEEFAIHLGTVLRTLLKSLLGVALLISRNVCSWMKPFDSVTFHFTIFSNPIPFICIGGKVGRVLTSNKKGQRFERPVE